MAAVKLQEELNRITLAFEESLNVELQTAVRGSRKHRSKTLLCDDLPCLSRAWDKEKQRKEILEMQCDLPVK